MSETEESSYVDKAGWPDGPWMHEPDRVEQARKAAR